MKGRYVIKTLEGASGSVGERTALWVVTGLGADDRKHLAKPGELSQNEGPPPPAGSGLSETCGASYL